MYLVIARRHWLGMVAVMVAVVVGVIGLWLPARSTTAGSWGLSFPTEGQPPVGNASADRLAEQDAYYIGDPNQKRVYLTFDAGYEAGYTSAILDALKRHNAPAAFFVVGHYLDTAPELVRRMVAEGHTVGNHTHSHPDMSAIQTEEAFLRELAGVEDRYRALIGQELPRFYRPPQGKYAPENLRMAKEVGYRTVFWSLAYVDWQKDNQPTPAQALDILTRRIHPGAVVLLHSTSATNSQMLDVLLTKWEEMGYTFGTLEELCGG